jgi:hypothetical protein
MAALGGDWGNQAITLKTPVAGVNECNRDLSPICPRVIQVTDLYVR